MKNGKYSRKGSKRIVTLLLALVLILGCGIGGTLAYLTANTQEVKNTFVMGDIGTLELAESDNADEGEDANNNQYVVVPGVDITKDPKVTYKYTQTNTTDYEEQDVYIFVTVDAAEENGTGWTISTDKMTYTVGTNTEKALLSWNVDDAWTFLKTENGSQVYYMAQSAVDNKVITKSIIAGDTITVSDKIEMKHLAEKIKDDNGNDIDNPDYIMDKVDDIVFKAYAIQQAGFEVYVKDTDGNDTAELDVSASAAKAWGALTATP